MIENGLQSLRRRGPKTALNNLIESFGFVAIHLAGGRIQQGGGRLSLDLSLWAEAVPPLHRREVQAMLQFRMRFGEKLFRAPQPLAGRRDGLFHIVDQ